MMNKAEKRVAEVKAIESAYNAVVSSSKSFEYDIEYWQKRKEDNMEENPETDTSYEDAEIERAVLGLKTLDKVLETIYKLM